jgi:arginine decarboxylase
MTWDWNRALDWMKKFPLMIIDDELQADTAEGKILRSIISEMEQEGLAVIQATTLADARRHFIAQPEICCILLDWDMKEDHGAPHLVTFIRKRNAGIPLFLFTEKTTVKHIPLDVLSRISGYIWKMEDTPDFIAGRIAHEIRRYFDFLLPPFFKEIITYVTECKYSWHTPGHMGGTAFLKSPAGRIFFEFFGENALRADLSVSVPELGSLLEHTGVVEMSEKKAAKIFGAERTYFVTNGTSTANKIVFQSCVAAGDLVLVDRNCHKSIIHAITMTGAVPIYLAPTRNAYGIIGPVHSKELEASSIEEKIRRSPFNVTSSKRIKLAIMTNSTYDGLCYNVKHIISRLSPQVDNLHFDEAWYGYARFHSLYSDRYAMSDGAESGDLCTLFSTQSTHKVLAALSQASMIHVKSGRNPHDHDRFNEAYMMHMSTSPQYMVVASLDVAARMMDSTFGQILIDETIEEALLFRQKIALLGDEIRGRVRQDWWFNVWQPDAIVPPREEGKIDEKHYDRELRHHQEYWSLKPRDHWHGFQDLAEDYCMLDPIKVTILTPGINEAGEMSGRGIPASIVTAFLRRKGIVVEKTGHYSFLILFTIGITKGKSGTLLAELLEFKRLYDENAPMEESFSDLVERYPHHYGNLGIRDFCQKMHQSLAHEKITALAGDLCSRLPEQVTLPSRAYAHVIGNKVDRVRPEELNGRTAAVTVVPYPPGIPVIMPGERFDKKTSRIIEYLTFCQDFDSAYPGFENEVHGALVTDAGGKKVYEILCIR